VRRSLETAQPGDLLVIFGDALDRDWRQIVGFGKPAVGADGAGNEVPVTSIFASEGDLPPSSLSTLAVPEPVRDAGELED
jgi:hypothetical protein